MPYPCAWGIDSSWPASDIITKNVIDHEKKAIDRGEYLIRDDSDFYRADYKSNLNGIEREIAERTESLRELQVSKMDCYDKNRTEPPDQCIRGIDYYIGEVKSDIYFLKFKEENK